MKNNKKDKGQVLAIIIIVSVLLVLIATALIGFAMYSYSQATFYTDYSDALYVAEAGLNYLVAQIGSSGSFSTFYSDTVGTANRRFAVGFYSTGTTLYAESTGIIYRIRPLSRVVQVQLEVDSPWNHFMYVGGTEAPAGRDPTNYPPPYNSTNNGPLFGQRYIPMPEIGISSIDSTINRFLPYYDKVLNGEGLFLDRNTTIGTVPSGLQYYWQGNTCILRGTYTGILYVNGNLATRSGWGNTLTINGSLIVVGGNIEVGKNTRITVNQNTSKMNYVSIACIDTTLPQSLACDTASWINNPYAGNILQQTGNAELWVNGGLIWCSNIYLKDGQGTNIRGILVSMGMNINGFPSGSYTFDPNVYLNQPLGFDISRCLRPMARLKPGSWRELPLTL